MTFKSYFFIVLAGIILLSLAFFTGRWTKPDPPLPETITNVTAISDTSKVAKASATKIIYKPKKPQLVKDSVYIANFDSSFVDSSGNEITSMNTVSFNEKQKTFQLTEQIEVKGFDTIIRDTVLIEEDHYYTKEVEADPPFYNTWLFGFISGIATVLLIIFGVNL